MADDSCLYRGRNNVYFICIHPLSPSTYYDSCFYQIDDDIGVNKKTNKITLQRGRRTSGSIVMIQKKKLKFFFGFYYFSKGITVETEREVPETLYGSAKLAYDRCTNQYLIFIILRITHLRTTDSTQNWGRAFVFKPSPVSNLRLFHFFLFTILGLK